MTESIAGQLVEAFDVVWQSIRERHADVPPVMVTLASGTLGAKPGQVRYGHFAESRWQRGESERLPELFISGEGLQRGAVPTLGTLLHEAAHGVAHVRGIKDTSRQGRYHNRRFKVIGEELGLTLEEDSRIGWSVTTVPATTAEDYSEVLDVLSAAIVVFRHAEVTLPKRTKASNLAVASCACPRKIRVAKGTLAEAPIMCGACDAEFTADETD